MVKKYYQMNPETEELLANGAYLQDGMTVLIEDPNKRVDLRYADKLSDWEAERALVNNRWAVISNVGLFRNDVNDLCVSFVATYEDSTQRHRKYHYSNPWLVKKGFVPDENKSYSHHQTAEVREIIYEAARSVWPPSEAEGPQFDQYVKNATQRILDTLVNQR